MRDALGMVAALVSLAVGTVLLYDGVSNNDANQSTRTIAGAALLSLGFILLRVVVRNWWKWRKFSKSYRNV